MIRLPLGTVLSQGRGWKPLQLCPQRGFLRRTDVAAASRNRAGLDIASLPPPLLIALYRPGTDAEDASGLRLRHPLVNGAKQMGPEVV
jgi:hypothetical protein